MLSHRHTERTGFDVIDSESESADEVTMYTVITRRLTFANCVSSTCIFFSKPFSSRSRSRPRRVTLTIKKRGKVVGFHTFSSRHHYALSQPVRPTSPPIHFQEVYMKRSDALVTHCNFPTLKRRQIRRKMIKRQTRKRKWESRALFFLAGHNRALHSGCSRQ